MSRAVDADLLHSLIDTEWRTPNGIKAKFKFAGRAEDIRDALDGLADQGRIDRISEPRAGIRRMPGRISKVQLRPIMVVRYRRSA